MTTVPDIQNTPFVIPGLDPGIHFDFELYLLINVKFNMDYRVKPGNDGGVGMDYRVKPGNDGGAVMDWRGIKISSDLLY